MNTISDAVMGQEVSAVPAKEADELHRNAHRTSSLRKKLREGRGWEGALVGLVKGSLSQGEVTGEPGWRRHRFHDTNTTFEFESFVEWITDPNGLGTRPEHLVQLLEISPDEEGRALADRVRQELKLPAGTRADRADFANNVREVARENRLSESGNSAAGVRRKIRNWIKANIDHPNHALAEQWLAKLESNPRSRLHQQALREIGIGGERKKLLDVSGVSDSLLDRLHAMAQSEGVAVAELIEDALAVYLRMEDEPLEPASNPVAAITELPQPGFYSAPSLGRILGKDGGSASSYCAKRKDGALVWEQELRNTPIKVIARKGRPKGETLEVVWR